MSNTNINENIPYHVISGKDNGDRVESRVLEELVQQAVAQGHRYLHINAFGPARYRWPSVAGGQ